MNNKENVITEEENSISDIIENVSNVLIQNIKLLNEFIKLNEEVMSNIEYVLNKESIFYEVDENGYIRNLTSDQTKENRFDQDKLEVFTTKYNESIKCIKEIEKTKKDVESTMLIRIKSEMVKRVTEELEQVGHKILEAQEKERSRIACDLHDSVIQNLTNLVHRTELCIMTADRDIVQVKLELQIMMQYIRSIINDIRHIVYNLRPVALEDLGLETSIQQFIQNFEDLTNVKIHLNNSDQLKQFKSPIVELTVFRILQEACSNAHQHGEAKNIYVDFTVDSFNVNLEIRDDGKGFDTKGVSAKEKNVNRGFGLSIMKERVYLLSGVVDIISKVNKGTVIKVSIPMLKV